MKGLLQLGLLISTLSAYSSQSKPNVILVMTDDMGYECLSVNGGQPYKTPNMDRIANEGVRFADAYSNTMCTPTRVKIMSGRYNFRNYEDFAYMNPDIYTIGNLMRDAGYSTAIVGKWQLNGYGKFAVREEERWPRMHKNGFDEFCLWNGKLDFHATPDQYHKPIIEWNEKVLRYDGALKGRYGPDVLMDFACDFISRKKDKPFFIYYPMMLPHAPYVPTPDSLDPNCTDEDQNFSDMVAYTDKLMERLFKHLEQEGVLNNTLVLITGDNGSLSYLNRSLDGRKLTSGKVFLTDDGTRAFLIAYWKDGMKAGQVCHDLIDFSDFMPTLAEVAGIPAPSDTDGVSFLPQITGKIGTPRKWIYVQHDTGPKFPRYEFVGRWVRNHDYKLYGDGRIFNTKLDPDESQDLSHSANSRDLDAKNQLAAVLSDFPPWNPITPREEAK